MKNFFSIVGILFLLTITGCADTPVSDGLTQSAGNQSNSIAPVRPIDDALGHVDKWFQDMDKLNGTRSAMNRTIKSVEVLSGSKATRSNGIDSLFYLVNYDNDGGFALLGAREGTESIYAISDEGRLSMEDTVFNKGLQIFMEAAEEQVASVIYNPPTNPPLNPTYIYGIKRIVGNTLNVNIRKWNQTSPFNAYCPNNGVVGCGPVAAGMLMAYYRYPISINGMNLDWNAMIEGNDYDKIAAFLEKIAGSSYLNSYYDTYANGSTNYSSRATPLTSFLPTFSKCGYGTSNCWNFNTYPSLSSKEGRTAISGFIENGIPNTIEAAPLIVYGWRYVGENKSAHVWVSDKYAERVKSIVGGPTDIDGNPIYQEADPMMYMIWGWGGTGNGYYIYLCDQNSLEDHPYNSTTSIGRTYMDLKFFGRLKK